MKIYMVLLGLLFSHVAYAADITGVVTVLNRDGKKPLKSSANAVVFLDGFETSAPEEPAVLDQKKKYFLPRLLPAVRGQEIQILNSDRVRHNVFSPHEEEPFDLGRYPRGEYRSVTFEILGQHKIYCDIHQQMIADIYVLPNHYFGITDKEGNFTIKDVPSGEYTLKVWHIYGGEDKRIIQVAEQPVTVDFTITSQKKIREITQHRDKRGRRYKKEKTY